MGFRAPPRGKAQKTPWSNSAGTSVQGRAAQSRRQGAPGPAGTGQHTRRRSAPKRNKPWLWVIGALLLVALLSSAISLKEPSKGMDGSFPDATGIAAAAIPKSPPPALLQATAPASPAPQKTAGPAPTRSSTPSPSPSPAASPAPTYAVLKQGMSGAAVKDLQNQLIALGYLSGNADGDFGKATKAAVSAFQKANGLEADGIAGPQTLSALYASAQKQDRDVFVWIVDTGYAYHNSKDCSNMKAPYQITLSEAQRLDRSPCKKCYR